MDATVLEDGRGAVNVMVCAVYNAQLLTLQHAIVVDFSSIFGYAETD